MLLVDHHLMHNLDFIPRRLMEIWNEPIDLAQNHGKRHLMPTREISMLLLPVV